MHLIPFTCQKSLGVTCLRRCRRLFVIMVYGCGLLTVIPSWGHAENVDGVRVHQGGEYVDAGPLPASTWEVIQTELATQGPRFLVMRVNGAGPGILGEYQRVDDRLRFRPRFALRPALEYVIEFNLQGQLKEVGHGATQQLNFKLPPAESKAPERVREVYPTANQLPENLLKFYVQFSGPMSQGEAYRRIRLVDEDGNVIELPFLELGQELWDPAGTRLTLLFDPGRVKRGLKPRKDEGQVLHEGREYRLVIDSAWPDATGQPLAADFEKRFQVTVADYQQPDPAVWELKRPAVETRTSLVITFREALDRGMLERVFHIEYENGEQVATEAFVMPGERAVEFRPRSPWKPGRFHLRFDPALEDVAGNSVGRAFEVQEQDPSNRRPPIVERTFELRR